ncbi:MAG: ribulose-phosphate 3-epimerase [Balneolaceae bacterium]|nr:ribulose-phosphate 3-epimerase [Balneolaceae bacterium]
MEFDLPILAPSILAADYTRLGEEIGTCMEAGVHWIHCDIMDGHFVPNISYGPDIVEAAGRAADAHAADASFLDVHLMIENPDDYTEAFVEAGADQITVHQETCPHLHRSLQKIKQYGVHAGVALNPATPVSVIEPVLEEVDLVLVMSVNPGFGGQNFIEATYRRLQQVHRLRREGNHSFLIEVDGGVGLDNIERVVGAGADVLVAGSSVFKADNIPARISELTKKARAGTANWA